MNIGQLPNLVSIIRLLSAAALLLPPLFSRPFFVLYLICGASDVLDGYLARRLHASSARGATLDSAADVVFTVVLLVRLAPAVPWTAWQILWTAAIAAVRCASLLVGWVKFRDLSSLHTDSNKATGVLLYCFPALYLWLGLTATAFLLCGAASYSAVEELCINLRAKTLNKDVKGLFLS